MTPLVRATFFTRISIGHGSNTTVDVESAQEKAGARADGFGQGVALGLALEFVGGAQLAGQDHLVPLRGVFGAEMQGQLLQWCGSRRAIVLLALGHPRTSHQGPTPSHNP